MLSIPRYTGWEPPRMTSAGLSTASSPSSGKRCLGGGEGSAKHPLQSLSLEGLASCWLLCPQFALSWLHLGLKEQLQGCPLCAMLRPHFQNCLCKITITPPCSTLPTLFPSKTTSSRGSCGADAHQRLLYKEEKKPFSSVCY